MSAILFLTRRVYRRSVEVRGIAAHILDATRSARRGRLTDNPAERAACRLEEARSLLAAASYGLSDQGISTETLLRVAAQMAERCAQGVAVAEEMEAQS